MLTARNADEKNYLHFKIHISELPEHLLDPEALLTEKQVMAITNWSISKLKKDRAAGTGIKFIKVDGDSIRYRRGDVHEHSRKQPEYGGE